MVCLDHGVERNRNRVATSPTKPCGQAGLQPSFQSASFQSASFQSASFQSASFQPGLRTITLTGQTFASQLLRSHLHVAGIGLLVVLVALLAILFLHTKVNTVIYAWVPIDRVGSRILADVQTSVANLRGWVVRGEPGYLQQWQHSWEQGINPAFLELRQRLQAAGDAKGQRTMQKLWPLLRQLYIDQWQVQDVALTPGNEPARDLVTREVRPVADKLIFHLNALIKGHHVFAATDPWDLVVFMRVDHAFNDAMIELDSFAEYGNVSHRRNFWRLFNQARHHFQVWAKEHPSHPHEQKHLIVTVQREFRVTKTLADAVMVLRDGKQRNVAQFLMQAKAAPRAERVLDILAHFLSHARQVMDKHAQEATWVSKVTIVMLFILVVLMIVTAFQLSRRRAWMLTKPVMNLVHGAKALAEGRLQEDVPVTTDNELGGLIRSFNTMRLSLQQSKQALETSNTALQQRAEELLQVNREVRDFVYIVSHDLRSPLVSIQGFMEELQMDLDEIGDTLHGVAMEERCETTIKTLLNVRIPEDLAYIRASSDKMERLTTAILKLSRCGRDHLQFEWLELRTLVEEQVAASAHTIKSKGVTIKVGAGLPLKPGQIVESTG